jgi:hypothetical protein
MKTETEEKKQRNTHEKTQKNQMLTTTDHRQENKENNKALPRQGYSV